MNTLLVRYGRLISFATVGLLLVACGGGSKGPPPDTQAPDTSISAQPASLSNSATATFAFSSTESGAVFEASLDGAAFVVAASPVQFNSLLDGQHTFAVRARDAAGNTDSSAATFTWTVDTQAPETQLVSAPPAGAVVSAGSINVTSPDATATFEGSLDSGAFAAITFPRSIAGYPEGPHTLAIRARDAANNADASPVVTNWILDVSGPAVKIRFPPSALSHTDADSITVRGTAVDAAGVASLTVNGVPATTSNNFATWSAVLPLASGSQAITVDAADSIGHAQANAASVAVVRRCLATSILDADFDPAMSRVIVVDGTNGTICAYPTAGGEPQFVADLSSRSAPGDSDDRYSGITVEPARNRILMIDNNVDTLLAVNIATGAVVELSPSAGTSAPTKFDTARSRLALDVANDRALVLSRTNARLIAIDLATGSRSIAIPSVELGTNVTVSVDGMVYDDVTTPATPRLLLARSSPQGAWIYGIDMATGASSEFWVSPLRAPTIFPEYNPQKIVRDAEHRRLLAVDNADARRILAFDLDTGALSVAATVDPFTESRIFPSYNRISGLMYVAQFSGAVDAVDLAAQTRTNIGNSFTRAGVPTLTLSQMFMDATTPGNGHLLFFRGDSVERFNIASGARTVVASDQVGSGDSMSGRFARLDTRAGAPAGRMLVALTSMFRALTSVDLTTGNRTPDNSTPQSIENFAIDGPGNRVFALIDLGFDNMCFCEEHRLYSNLTELNVPNVNGWGAFEYSPLPTPSLLRYYPNYEIRAVDVATFATTSLVPGKSAVDLNGKTTGPRGAMHVDIPNGHIWWMQSHPSGLFRAPLPGGVPVLVSGRNPDTGQVQGTGPSVFDGAFTVDADNGIAYALNDSWWLLAIDTQTGQRVVIAR